MSKNPRSLRDALLVTLLTAFGAPGAQARSPASETQVAADATTPAVATGRLVYAELVKRF